MAMRTWIVHRTIADQRAIYGTRTRPVGWVRALNEERAKELAQDQFGGDLMLEEMDEEASWGYL